MKKIIFLLCFLCSINLCFAENVFVNTDDGTMQLSCGTSHIVRGRVFYNGLGAMNGVTVALVVNQTVIESTQTDDSGFFSFNVNYSGTDPIELLIPGYVVLNVLATKTMPPFYIFTIEEKKS
ncbi:MAG: hypothetical protein MR561_10135 [Prevotella sp.]|nr:hypothetical protein [Prevotella sp.]MCI7270560.1 hypothetical protein [Prevotella sp.]MDD7127570.1 hypothetical protein [Prevotella sp.]